MFEKDAWGRNRLHWAALTGDRAEVKWLLDKGMPIDAKDGDQMSAFRLAIKGNHLDVVKDFVSRGVKVTRLQINEAGRRGYGNMMLFLWSTFCTQDDVTSAPKPQEEQVDKRGRNRLHRAALRGNLDKVKLLLNEGMSIDVKDGSQMSPFRLAIKGNHLEVVKYFVTHGAKVTRIQINEAERRGYKELELFLRQTFLNQSGERVSPEPPMLTRGLRK